MKFEVLFLSKALTVLGFVIGGMVGCGQGPVGLAVCQEAQDHAAQCMGAEVTEFTGICDGALADSAREVLTFDCAVFQDQSADGFLCPDFLVSTGFCGGASATLGPWGIRSTKVVSTRSECRHNSADLIEPGLELMNVQTVEKCLETRAFRPVIDLGDEGTYFNAGVPYPDEEREAILSPYGLQSATDALVLGNVGHVDGVFTVAVIPLTAFEEATVYYLIETFEVRAIRGSHGMVRVRFDEPVVELYSQYPTSRQLAAVTQEIVLSVHATAIRGGSYDPLGAGLNDGMALARGIFSIEGKVQDVLLIQNHTVEQYRLLMTGDDIRRYVETYSSGSPDRIFTTSYHTFRRNCGTELLQVFADAFPERGYPPPETLDNTPILEVIDDALNGRLLPDIVPELVRPALESRGLFGGVADPWSTDPTIQELVGRLQ